MNEPKIIAILYVGENEFYAGIGATREDAFAALAAQPGAEGVGNIADDVDYLPLVPQATGWSLQTD